MTLQESNMTRYHRSFIGLMEQSNDGEWVKYDDYAELARVLDNSVENYTTLKMLCDNLEKHKKELIWQRDEYKKQMLDQANRVSHWALQSSFFEAMSLMLLVATVVLAAVVWAN
jgi:hypothetical protein